MILFSMKEVKNYKDMSILTKQSTRTTEKIVQDFIESKGHFESFYLSLNEVEMILFKQYLHGLRIKAHSPLLAETTETN